VTGTGTGLLPPWSAAARTGGLAHHPPRCLTQPIGLGALTGRNQPSLPGRTDPKPAATLSSDRG
jgi:hypothetical protein